MTGLGANLVAKAALVGIPAGANIERLLAARPESILMIGGPQIAARGVRDLREKGFRGPIYAFSNTGEGLLADLLGPSGAGLIVTRVVPKSGNAEVPVVHEMYADAAAANAGTPNVYLLEG